MSGPFVYPDPSLNHHVGPYPLLYHLLGPLHGQQLRQHRPMAATSIPATTLVSAPSAPPLPIDPALFALPGPAAPAAIQAPIAAPVLAPAAGAPPLSVVGATFPGFPAGLAPPMQVNGGDAARYNSLVAGTINSPQSLRNCS